MAQITKGATTIYPAQVLGYEAASETTTKTHELVSGAVSATVGAERPRSGTLKLLFATAALAVAARTFHAQGGVFVLTDALVPAVNMSYVRKGTMSLVIDDDTSLFWTLAVGYQEVV